MTTVHYPSERFPAPPALSFDLPDGWEPTIEPGSVLAAHKPTAGSVSTIVVRVEHREEGFDVAQAVQEIQGLALHRPRGVASAPFRAEIDGLTFVGLDLSWVDDRLDQGGQGDQMGPLGTLLEVHLFHALEPLAPGGVSSTIHLIGSCGGLEAAAEYAVLQTVLTCGMITPWSFPGERIAL